MHLDEERYEAMLAGRPVSPELAAHLEEDCEICDAFLASRETTDPLDGVVDEALFGVSDTASQPAGDLTYRRVEQNLRGTWRSTAVAVGVAAIAIAAAFALMPREPTQNLKGPTDAPRVDLQLMVTNDGTAPTPIADGGKVAVGATVLFRVTLDRAACVGLWSGEERLLESAMCFERGAYVLEQEGRPLGLVVDEPGTKSFRLAPVERGPTPPSVPVGASTVRVSVE